MKLLTFVALVGCLVCSGVAAQTRAADPLERHRAALQIISEFADRFCKEIRLQTSSERIEASGEAKAQVSNLIKRLADLGIDGSVKYLSETAQGPLREQLMEMTRDNTQCRLRIWNDLKGTILDASSNPARGTTPSPHGASKESRVGAGTELGGDSIRLSGSEIVVSGTAYRMAYAAAALSLENRSGGSFKAALKPDSVSIGECVFSARFSGLPTMSQSEFSTRAGNWVLVPAEERISFSLSSGPTCPDSLLQLRTASVTITLGILVGDEIVMRSISTGAIKVRDGGYR
jgi:hypothetical protein